MTIQTELDIAYEYPHSTYGKLQVSFTHSLTNSLTYLLTTHSLTHALTYLHCINHISQKHVQFGCLKSVYIIGLLYYDSVVLFSFNFV